MTYKIQIGHTNFIKNRRSDSMPRMARIKSEESMYHIMVRGNGENNLYKDYNDKDRYLDIIKKYKHKFGFKVYGYCLMDTHGHLLIDPCGADISKIMHGINQSYAQYFNRRHKIKGHVFGDRFKSKIVDSERYLITLSVYIHNNPKDLKGWSGKIDKYPYSSLGVYLNTIRDRFEIVDIDYILGMISSRKDIAKKGYKELILKGSEEELEKQTEFKDEKTEYRSERVVLIRDYKPKDVIEFVSKYTNIPKIKIHTKYAKKSRIGKAVAVLLMRRFCDFTYRSICKVLGDITQPTASKLCGEGIEIVCNKNKYKNIMDDFLSIAR